MPTDTATDPLKLAKTLRNRLNCYAWRKRNPEVYRKYMRAYMKRRRNTQRIG